MIRLGYKLKNYPTDIIGLLDLSYFQIEQDQKLYRCDIHVVDPEGVLKGV